MKLDVYSPCPGGLDNKIKFCCKDLLPVLESIQNQLDGDQPHAALAEIDRQLATTPDRACLLALKIEALEMASQGNDAGNVAAHFCDLFPNNPIALAYQAVNVVSQPQDLPKLAVDDEASRAKFRGILRKHQESAVDAIDKLQTALGACHGNIPFPLFASFGAVANSLLANRMYLPCFQHLLVQARLASNDEDRYLQAVNNYLADPHVSPFFKNEFRFEPLSDDVSWRESYQAAARLGNRCQWREALAEFETLLARHGNQPILLRGAFIASASLGLTGKAVDTLRKIADSTPDALAAMEAEATALELELTSGRYAAFLVQCESDTADAAAALERLQSHPQVRAWPGDLATLAEEGSPPPKGVFYIADRPFQVDDPVEREEDLPQLLVIARFYGKETDRPARITWPAVEHLDLESSIQTVQKIMGDLITTVRQTLMGMRIDLEMPQPIRRIYDSASRELRERAAGSDELLVETMANWKKHPNPLLDGKTPEEAAQQPSLRRRLQALLVILECRAGLNLTAPHAEQLRQDLGLDPVPLQMTITAGTGDVPLWRLARLDVANTDTILLVQFFGLALRCRLQTAQERIGEELLRRIEEGEAVDVPADRIHFVLARLATNLSGALERLQKAESIAVKQGRSPAEYLLHELTLHLHSTHLEKDRLQRIVQLLTTRYAKEPGVMDQLRFLLYQAGLITADGRPVALPPTTSSAIVAGPAAEPVSAAAIDAPAAGRDAPPAPPSKLWLPGQD